jgi:CRISPR system Cascade subunit CasE
MSVQFDGILRVSDPDKLHAAIENGIGSGKGFGFGLLSLAPA